MEKSSKTSAVPSITVVIPLYNHAAFVGAALASVAAQTLQPGRVVVVDDGSSDGSAEVARNFARAHPEVPLRLIEQANAGAHVALNRAIAEAGEVDFISILNSDDTYEPGRLARCAAFLQEHPAAVVVCTGMTLMDARGELLPAENPKVRRLRRVWADASRDPAAWLGEQNFTKTTSNYFVRADYARRHPFRDYRYAHDYFFASQAAWEDRLGVIAEPLLRYRTHATNTIKADGSAPVAKELVRLVFDLLREMAPRLGESEAVRAAAARYFGGLLRNAADFRAEVFLALMARLLAEGSGCLASSLAGLAPGDFPELSAPPRSPKIGARIDKRRSLLVDLGQLFGRART